MTRAVAGATTTASADCPSRVCGMGSSSWNSEVWARSEASAENVASPTNRVAPRVITGTTWAPRSTRRRQTSMALYAAMPPDTPRTMRRPSSMELSSGTDLGGPVGLAALAGLRLGGPDVGAGHCLEPLGAGLVGVFAGGLGRVDEHDLVAGDLLEGDGERLAGHGRHLRRHDGTQALAQLVEVGVDLPGAHGAQRDQRELRPGAVEQLLDGGVHHRVLA